MDGEFGRLLGWVLDLGLRGLAGCLLIALPVAAILALVWLHKLPRLRAYWHVPIVAGPPMVAGALLAWCLLYADPFSPSFRIASIFEVGGEWDVPWPTFLRYRADPALYDYQSLLNVLRVPDLDPVLALVLLGIGILLIVAIVAALACLRGADLAAGLLGIAFLFVFSQAVTVYATALLAYTLNTLNFWAALVALAILQYCRRLASHRGH